MLMPLPESLDLVDFGVRAAMLTLEGAIIEF